MSFRQNAWATVWSVEKKNDNVTKVRIATSRKNKMTDEYEQDFGGFVDFVGKDAAQKALQLKKLDRIKLGDVAVTNRYDKEKGVTYTNFSCYSFEVSDGRYSGQSGNSGGNPMYDGGNGEPDPGRSASLPY